MAFLRDCTHTCRHPSCTSRATVELVNSRNASNGFYCKRHGAQAVKDLQALEQATTNHASRTQAFDVT